MNVSDRPAPRKFSQVKPMFNLVPEHLLTDNPDDNADCDQRSKNLERSAADLEPYTVRDVVELTGVPRHRIYRMIHDLEIDARMAPHGRCAWLIPSYEVRRLMLMDLSN